MQIKAEKSRYHRFALYFDYTPDRIEFCRVLKDSLGWQRFSFNSTGGEKRWVFSETVFVKLLSERFPEVEIEPAVMNIWQHEDPAVAASKRKEEAVERVREKKDTDLEIKGIKGDLYDYQKVGVEFLLASGGRAIIADPPGLGKELSFSSRVATPNGWKTIGSLVPGDTVIGRSGKPTKVTGVYPQGVKPLYRFTLRDGSSVLAGREHLWAVKNRNHIRRNRDWDVVSTKELLSRSLQDGDGKNQYMIPFVEPVQYPERTFTLSTPAQRAPTPLWPSATIAATRRHAAKKKMEKLFSRTSRLSLYAGLRVHP